MQNKIVPEVSALPSVKVQYQTVSVHWMAEHEMVYFSTILRSEHEFLKTNKPVFLCLDLCFRLKTSGVLILAPLVSGATQTWMFCLNVTTFVSKQISIQSVSDGNRFPHGAGGWMRWL